MLLLCSLCVSSLLACGRGEQQPDPNDRGEPTDTQSGDLDSDGDGVRASEDCDDQDASVWQDGELESLDSQDGLSGVCDSYCALQITGNVQLRDATDADLEALSCVTAIGGDLWIRDAAAVTTLAPLGGLQSIGDALIIEQAQLQDLGELAALTDLHGLILREMDSFNSLQAVAGFGLRGDLQVYDLPALASIEGVDGALQISDFTLSGTGVSSLQPLSGLSLGSVELIGNAVEDLSGLEHIDHLEVLRIESEAVTSLTPLSKLTEVERMTLQDLELGSLSGLESLAFVEQRLLITGVSGVSDLNGLSGLRVVGTEASGIDSLDIVDLPDLEYLGGLHSLEEVIGTVSVAQCPQVSQAEREALEDALEGKVSEGLYWN